MKHSLAPLAFALGSTALVVRGDQQCVQLKASGSTSGTLGQLSDGQNRVGGGYTAACYCLSNGGFTDNSGRGCILTPPTTQFQCDTGASPTTGFSISSSGSVTYNGSAKFYACPATNSEYNIYTQPVSDQEKCVEITLSSSGSCGASASPSQPAASSPAASSTASSSQAYQPSQPASSKPVESSPAPKPSTTVESSPSPTPSQPIQSTLQPQPSPSKPTESSPAQVSSSPAPPPSTLVASKPASSSAPSPSGSSCPTNLSGSYQYPHLIVPVSSSSPNTAYGTSYFGAANKTTCSIFNFDIPSSYSGQTCTVVFLFPEQSQLQTSSYTVSGSGGLEFSSCSSAASQSTMWDSKPSCQQVSTVNAAPGNSYTITTGKCKAGQTVSYEMCASGDFSLNYFQDYNLSPIGLYVRAC